MTDPSKPAGREPQRASTGSPATTSVSVLSHPAPALQILERAALPILAILVYVFFAFNPASSGTFPSIANLNIILGSQAVVTLLALASLFPLIAGYFDFSLGAIAAFAQVLTAGLMAKSGWPLWAAVIVSILMGAAVGTLNGYLITKRRMNPFVTTLGVALLISGISIWYTAGQTIASGIDPAITRFGSSRWLGLPTVVFVVLAIAVLAWYFLTHTPYGRSIYAIGSNAASARLVGIRVERNVWWTFIVGGAIAGGAGVMQLSRIGSATAGAGNELLFPALAAVFLGATAITPGFFNVFGTIIGAIFVSVSVSGLTLSGAGGWAANVFNGIALVVAVGLSTYLGRRRTSG